MDPEKLAAMSTEELAAAREQASDDEKAAIDAELTKRQSEPDADEAGGASDADGDETVEKADPETQTPYGAQVLAAAVEALSHASSDISGAAATVEQPNVKTQLDALGETLDGVLASLKETYASEYPDAPPLAGADETTPPPTEDVAMLKSFVSMGRDRLMRASGLVARLNAAISLSPRVAAAAAPVLKSLRDLIRDAKKPDANSFKPVTDELAKLKSAFKK